MENKLIIIAGPCVIENKEVCHEVATELVRLSKKYNFRPIFKASISKANRSSIDSFTGINKYEALEILNDIHHVFGLETITDVHTSEDIVQLMKYENINHIQIPAFLCRQTELLTDAGLTGKIVNVKKGQWMTGDAMGMAVEKVRSTSNKEIWLTERGNIFGYKDLVVDMTNIQAMKKHANRVILDCTHSVQKPNTGITTGGDPSSIETLAKCGVVSEVDGLFFEVHPDPSKGLSDPSSMLKLDKFESVVKKCVELYKFTNNV